MLLSWMVDRTATVKKTDGDSMTASSSTTPTTIPAPPDQDDYDDPIASEQHIKACLKWFLGPLILLPVLVMFINAKFVHQDVDELSLLHGFDEDGEWIGGHPADFYGQEEGHYIVGESGDAGAQVGL